MKPVSTTINFWLKASLFLALLSLVAGGAWFHRDQQRAMRIKAEENLSAIAQLKVSQIVDWRAERLDVGSILSDNPFFVSEVARFFDHPSGKNKKEVVAYLSSLESVYHYADILLVNPDGNLILSMNGTIDLNSVHVPAVEAALRVGSPVCTDFYNETKKAIPHISVVAPLFSGSQEAQKPLGAVILVNNPAQSLYTLIQSWPTPNQTAEIMLVRRDGDDALVLNDLRHLTDTALQLRFPLRRTDLIASMAVSGQKGIVTGRDYRKVDVLAAILPVPESDWFMVSKVDAYEIFANWRFRSTLILALMLGSVIMIGTTALLLWQWSKKSHYQELFLSETRLRTSMERHSVTLKSIGDGVIAADARGVVELLNPVAEELTGWTQAEARGRPLSDVFRIINEQTRESAQDPVSRILHEGVVVGLADHTLLIARDGTERPIEDSGAPIRDDKGEIVGVALVFRDKTAERTATKERQLAEKERERLLAAIEQAGEMIIITDPLGTIQYVNPAFERVTGYTRNEAIGKNPRILKSGKQDTAFYANLWATITSGRTFQGRIVNKRKDGTLFTEETSIAPVRDASGRIVNYVAVKHDITDQLRIMDQLLHAQKMESVGRLAGGVAHDFNNMLSVIIGFSELAMNKVGTFAEVYSDLNEILNAAKRSAEITRQLLAFARKQTIEPRKLDLNEIVEGMLKMLRRLIGEDIDLSWHPGNILWPILMDPSQLEQILANLCVNARDAIPGTGRVTIETHTATFDEAYCSEHPGVVPGEFVLLAVSDNGCGMDRAILENIFEPFFTTKGESEGTGLGLATVYGIVKQNKGFINVYSELGQGTTFRIYLPRHLGKAESIEADVKIESPVGRGEMVLIVEDEPKILELCEKMLLRLGYKVLAAGTPNEAFKSAAEHPGEIHLLITDVIMPGMNGRDLAKQIIALHPAIKTLFMSGYTANVIVHKGILEEGLRFIHKPFSMKDLGLKVRQTLDDIDD